MYVVPANTATSVGPVPRRPASPRQTAPQEAREERPKLSDSRRRVPRDPAAPGVGGGRGPQWLPDTSSRAAAGLSPAGKGRTHLSTSGSEMPRRRARWGSRPDSMAPTTRTRAHGSEETKPARGRRARQWRPGPTLLLHPDWLGRNVRPPRAPILVFPLRMRIPIARAKADRRGRAAPTSSLPPFFTNSRQAPFPAGSLFPAPSESPPPRPALSHTVNRLAGASVRQPGTLGQGPIKTRDLGS